MPLTVASGVPGSSVISSFTALQSVLKEAALLRININLASPCSVLGTLKNTHTHSHTHGPSASWQNALALPRPLFAYEPCHAMPPSTTAQHQHHSSLSTAFYFARWPCFHWASLLLNLIIAVRRGACVTLSCISNWSYLLLLSFLSFL